MIGLMFRDRRQAGRQLADPVRQLGLDDPYVLALPRGGVLVAAELAAALDAPLDVIAVKRLREADDAARHYAAVTADGTRVLNDDFVPYLAGIEYPDLEGTVDPVVRELAAREKRFRERRSELSVRGRNVILVADGMATGTAMAAAATSLKSRQPEKMIVAVPVASQYAERRLLELVDDVICLDNPDEFFAIGCSYLTFERPGDDEIAALLATHDSAGTTDDASQSTDRQRAH